MANPYNTINPYNNKENADKILEEWHIIASSLKIDYLLIFGTCLGLYRDNGFIQGDNDIDIWIDYNQLSAVIFALKKHDFEVGRKAKKSQHFYKNNILLDIWLTKRQSEIFDTLEYNGKTYRIPHLVENYLKLIYGDWKTPSKQCAKACVFK